MRTPQMVVLVAVLLLGGSAWARTTPAAASTSGEVSLAVLQKQAASGNAGAELSLGKRLIQSKNLAEKSEGIAWFRKAAAQGNADAEWRLGFLYAVGDPSIGVTRDVSTGLGWMRKSLSNGSADNAQNMGLYGYMLAATGFKTGNKQDMHDGVEWIRRGAQGGSVQSMNTLGVFLLFGMLDVQPDKTAAEYWLLKSAKLGSAHSRELLGIAYLAGEFGKPNVEAGLRWLRAAARQGDVAAEGTLAMVLITGKMGTTRIPKNPPEGVQWASKAMAKHDAVGFYAMGNAYQYGDGETRNPAKAWYNYAVAKRLDISGQLPHVDQHLSEVATKLSAKRLGELGAEVSTIPIPTKKQQQEEWLKLAGGTKSP